VKLETLRLVLPLVVAGIIPLFFVVIYVGSCSSRLRSLRAQTATLLDELFKALRARLALADQLLQSGKDRPIASDPEFRQAQESIQALGARLNAPESGSPACSSPKSLEDLSRTTFQFEQALRRLLERAESVDAPMSCAKDPGWGIAWAENLVTLASAAMIYNQAADRHHRAWSAFPGGLVAHFSGGAVFGQFRFEGGEASVLPSPQRSEG